MSGSSKEFFGWPHALVNIFDCDNRKLNDLTTVYDFLHNLPPILGMKSIGAPVVYRITKRDHPDIGISGFQIIATSHCSFHSFPFGQKDGKRKPRGIERKIFKSFATIDVYSCSDFNFDDLITYIKKIFKPKLIEKTLIYRLREDADLIEVEQF